MKAITGMLIETPIIFVQSNRALLILFRNCSATVLLQLNMAKGRHVIFSALGPKAEENIKLQKNKIRFDFQLSKRDSGARI